MWKESPVTTEFNGGVCQFIKGIRDRNRSHNALTNIIEKKQRFYVLEIPNKDITKIIPSNLPNFDVLTDR